MSQQSSNTNRLITIDSIVRSYIHERGMLWHDYFRLLSIAIAGLKDLAKDLNISDNLKACEIPVDETGRAQLPGDLVNLIKVAIPNGDKLLPIPKTENINPVPARDEQGNIVRRPVQRPRPFDTVSFIDIGYFYSSQFNDKAEYNGRMFGMPPHQPYGYRQIEDKLQFDSRVNLECVYIIYTTNGLTTDINLLHPWAEETLKLWLDWKYVPTTRERKGIWENQNERRYYYNSKRNLNGALNGFGFEEYLNVVRAHQVMVAKL